MNAQICVNPYAPRSEQRKREIERSKCNVYFRKGQYGTMSLFAAGMMVSQPPRPVYARIGLDSLTA